MIRLTAIDAGGNDSPVLVDEDSIQLVTRTGDTANTTTIYLDNGVTVKVKESVSAIEMLVKEEA